jgi:thioester reductase-like protein
MALTSLTQADIHLAADIVPTGHVRDRCHTVLLTGATGFLGRQLLHEFLSNTDINIVCIIRAESDELARVRLHDALRDAGLNQDIDEARIRVIHGDIRQPKLGILPSTYVELVAQVNAIYHCAAEVNWIKNYQQLRRTNVLGTVELLRFACCGQPKALTFVSSLAVCFARGSLASIDEATDMLTMIEAMPLGYAQSKCVAETLLRQAALRGLPVTIIRPGLLSGDTKKGINNPADLVSTLLKGCVKSSEAADADWLFDSLPVDYAARSILALSRARQATIETYHLRHQKPRHWRELVLWLNLFGYPVRLIPTVQWLDRHFTRRGDTLSSYRKFFLGEPGAGSTERPFEVYLAQRQATISCEITRQRLAELGVNEPALDSDLLRRYMDHYVLANVLPPHPWPVMGRATNEYDTRLRDTVFSNASIKHRGLNGRGPDWEQLPFDAGNGILNEIASIRLGTGVGMRRYRINGSALEDPTDHIDVLVKAKVKDTVAHGLIADIANVCDPELGRHMRASRQALGLARSHLRELALYQESHFHLREFMPRCYGVVEDSTHGIWSVAMEYLTDVDLMDSANAPDQWLPEHRFAAIQGAARIHAAWYCQGARLSQQHWLAPMLSPSEIDGMSALWYSLAHFADPFFAAWTGTSLLSQQSHFIETAALWWEELSAMPQTLIHNDFNPRNLAFKRSNGKLKVCAFDWELARIGVPQHDLAELLCFTLPQQTGRAELARFLELHRFELSASTGIKIAPELWIRGFILALQHLLIDRLPFYTMAHRFKPQLFLPKVLRNWMDIYDMSLTLSWEIHSSKQSERRRSNNRDMLIPHGQ